MALTKRPKKYCTWLDVVQMILDVSTERINFSQLSNIIVRSGNHIEFYIQQADAMINMVLAEAYPRISQASWYGNSWTTPPIIPVNPDTGTSNNGGNLSLLSVACTETAYPAVWLLECTTEDTLAFADARYGLFSFLEGEQGTSKDFSASVTSTNGEIIIDPAAWVAMASIGATKTVDVSDKWMFSVNQSKIPLWMLSVALSTAFTLNSVYLGQSSTESPYGSMFFNRAKGMLDDIGKKKLAIETGLEEIDQLAPTIVKYVIDIYGNDNTKYLQDTYDSYRSI